MTDYIIPALFLIIFIFAAAKDMPAFAYFVEGAKSSVNLCIGVFPYLVAILTMVQLLKISGISAAVAQAVAPAFRIFGVPPELSELIILRPFSGAGSLAVLDDLYKTYGVDSYIGRCASVIVGSSDTVFYVAAVYFSTTKIKKLRFAIPVALLCSLAGTIIGCLLCRVI